MFQDRLAALEGAEACVATSTGMAAITTMIFGLLKSGDHLVTARGVFGTVVPLLDQIAKKFGIETTWVDATDLDDWSRRSARTRGCSTPSRRRTRRSRWSTSRASPPSRRRPTPSSPWTTRSPRRRCSGRRPGADLVVHSATKYIEGQGRVLAGAIAGRADLVSGSLFPFVRTAGPAISPYNAWTCLKGMETLGVRMRAHCANALEVARWLESHPSVERVLYPRSSRIPSTRSPCASSRAGAPWSRSS
jgi:O-succinylhomoserine sulfhydrylase